MNQANRITLIRISIIPFLVGIIFIYQPGMVSLRVAAILLFSLAVLTDGLDGFIARKLKQETSLGAKLDPLADKLLLMSVFVVLSIKRQSFLVPLPIFAAVTFIIRDLIMFVGTFLIFLVRNDVKIIPSSWGKLTALFQMMTALAVLLEFVFAPLIWSIALVLTLISGIDYIRRGVVLFTYSENNSNNNS